MEYVGGVALQKLFDLKGEFQFMQPEGLIPQRKENEQFYLLHKIGPLPLIIAGGRMT